MGDFTIGCDDNMDRIKVNGIQDLSVQKAKVNKLLNTGNSSLDINEVTPISCQFAEFGNGKDVIAIDAMINC